MTKAGETDPDKELQKAFAEFRQSLGHDPQAPHDDVAPKLAAPEIVVSEPRRPSAQQPKVDTRPVLGASGSHAGEDAPFPATNRPAPEEGRRRNLLYLSAAIVVSGLAAVGWALNHGARPEAPGSESTTAAVAPENPSPDAPVTTQTPAPAATAETPAAEAQQTAASPEQDPAARSSTTTTSSATTTPDQTGAPAAEKAALAPPETKEPATPPSPSATIAPTPAKTEASRANAKKPPTSSQADSSVVAKQKPAAKPRVAKAKPKPAPARNAARPTNPATGGRSSGGPPEPVADAVSAPPPAAPSNDGALGFVKRTVNSVGSTINNLGRNAIGD